MRVSNFEAEGAVLGAVLEDGTLFKELELKEEHFAHVNHQRIFHGMKQVDKKGDFIDMVSLTTYLGKEIYNVGGPSYLFKMADSIATTTPIKPHERFIIESYRNRKAQEAAMRYCENPTSDGLDHLIKSLKTYRDSASLNEEKTTYDRLIHLTEEMLTGNGWTGYMSSYKELDFMTGGFQPGDLIVIAARPSVGKTAFALNLAANHCKNAEATTIFSLEMGTKQLLQRMISKETHIEGQKWRNHMFSPQDYEAIIHAVGEISTWDLRIFDN